MDRRRTIRVSIVAAIAVTALAAGTLVASRSASGTATGTSGSRPATPASGPVTSTAPAGPPAAAPVTPGPPYAVGVTHIQLERDAGGSERSLPVTIRYPTPGAAAATEMTDSSASSAAFPIVIFIHGFDTSADTYAAMEHDLASAGFIVAAPDFPYTSSASAAGLNEDDVVNQAADVSFVIDSLTTAPPAVLTGHVASTKVGVVGHSDGAVTALGVADNSCCADPRIGAAVSLSGAETRFGGTWFPPGSPPLLAIHGTDDQVNAFASSQQVFADAPAPKYLVAVAGGSHLGPFTTDPVRPTVSVLVSDFLRAELAGDAQAASRISGDASSGGLQLAASG
jgi:alpha-beta hydrolase superfamily lysophospholipase